MPAVPECDLRETLDHAALASTLSGLHLIDGRLVPAASGGTFAILNPGDGTQIGRAADGDAADVDAAVASAVRAQKAWAGTAAKTRTSSPKRTSPTAASRRRGWARSSRSRRCSITSPTRRPS